MAFGLRDGLDQMIAAGMPAPAQIRASGGGTASPLWRQILADVLDAEIATVSTTEGAAYGAALLGAVGAGWFPTVEAAAAVVVRATPAPRHPDRTRRATPSAHCAYRELYPALAPTFHRSRRASRGSAAPRSAAQLELLRAPSRSTSPGLLPRMIMPERSRPA